MDPLAIALKFMPEHMRQRVEGFIRGFEWTWTKAAVTALLLWFLGIVLVAIIPSWWLYFADQKLGWHPCPCPSTMKFFLFKLRDVVAIVAFSIPFGGFVMVPYYLQKHRRRLRSESESRPTGGYR